MGKAKTAVEHCEVALAGDAGWSSAEAAETRFLLARAQWHAGERSIAQRSAQRAREEAGEGSPLAAKIERWTDEPDAFRGGVFGAELPTFNDGVRAGAADASDVD